MKKKSRVANLIANGSNALIHWQPFNILPMRALYNWAHKVRSNDPAWDEFLAKQAEKEEQRKQDDGESESGQILVTT